MQNPTFVRSNKSILKEINIEYSLEGLMLKLKLQYFGHLMPRADSLEKTLILGEFEGISSSVLSLLHGLTVTSVHDYWKIRALTISIFVSRVLPLLFNTLSRCVIAFLPRSKHLLISWLQWLSTVILEPKKIQSVTVSTFPPSICQEVMDQMPWS